MRRIKNEELELIRSIIKTKIDLESANRNFEMAEGELIDFYTYQIKAHKAKLNYLVKQVKEKGIAMDMINQIEMSLVDVS